MWVIFRNCLLCCCLGCYCCKRCDRKCSSWCRGLCDRYRMADAGKEDVESPRIAMPQVRKKVLYALALFMLLPATRSDNCVGTYTVLSEVPECARNGSQEVCDVGLSVLFSLPYSKSDACFVVSDALGTPLAEVVVSYEEQILQAEFETAYWTSNWKGDLTDTYTCDFGSSWCGKRCDGMDPADPTGDGLIKNTKFTTNPGRTGCSRPCGCWGCGCLTCDDSCLLYRWVIEPVPPYSEISTFKEAKRMILLSFMVKDFEGNIITQAETSLRPGVPAESGDWEIELIGSYDTPQITFNKALRETNGVFDLVNYSPKNVPQFGLPGDIQASAMSKFTSATGRSKLLIDKCCQSKHWKQESRQNLQNSRQSTFWRSTSWHIQWQIL